jgi:PIN domain nuclease of toxin-antitoxin system
MSFLLDTHVWLWMLTAPDRLRGKALDVIQDSRSRLVLSAVSSWEIAIKYSIGRLPLPDAPESYVPERIRASKVESMPITHAHALRVAALPRHHDDPFDRMLIAQAQLEQLTIITADPLLERYEVALLQAG